MMKTTRIQKCLYPRTHATKHSRGNYNLKQLFSQRLLQLIILSLPLLLFTTGHSIAVHGSNNHPINISYTTGEEIILIVKTNTTSTGYEATIDSGIVNATLNIEITNLNKTHAIAKILITGQECKVSTAPGSHNRYVPIKYTFTSLEELVRRAQVPLTILPPSKPIKLSLEYIVDRRSNYAWTTNGVFIGFFPFYSIPDLDYDNITMYKFVYLNETLELDMLNGKPTPYPLYLKDFYPNLSTPNIGGKDHLVCLRLYNNFSNIYIVHHYPVNIENLLLPIGNNTYLFIESILIDKRYLPLVISIDDYPEAITTIDYSRFALIIGIPVIGAGLAVYLWRARRRV